MNLPLPKFRRFLRSEFQDGSRAIAATVFLLSFLFVGVVAANAFLLVSALISAGPQVWAVVLILSVLLSGLFWEMVR